MKSKYENADTYKNDISFEEARAAAAGMSFVPEKRAQARINEWQSEMLEIYADLKKEAIAGETLRMLDAEFQRFHAAYLHYNKDYLRAKSNCVSSMIAGPSKYPAARQQKRMNAADKKLTALLDFKEKAIKAIKRKLRPELAPIMSGDDDAPERLEAKIAAAKAGHERLKELKAFCRKCSDLTRRHEKIKTLGINPAGIQINNQFDVESWALQNSNANIRRMEKRLQLVTARKAQANKEYAINDIRVIESPGENRVKIFFPGKPGHETRGQLKANGFRWAPSQNCWQAYYNTKAKRFAELMAKVKKDGEAQL